MAEDCGWRPVSSPASAWQLQPVALVLEDGGFLELDDCGLMMLESA